MSNEIRPEFRPRIRGLVYKAEGKALADCIIRIHSFSKKRGLRPITDFLDNRDVPDDMDFMDDDWRAGRTDWHSPAEGLKAVKALIQAIEADPRASKRWNEDDPDGLETLMDDLQQLAACLEKAVPKGVQFRLDLA